MALASVRALRSIEIDVTNLAESLRFYRDVWCLKPVAEVGGVHYFRGTGPHHYILAIRRAAAVALVRITFDAADRATLDALHGQVAALGLPHLGKPAALTTPGGGYGFGFQDPEGRNYAVVCDVQDHADSADQADRPRKLSHVNLNTTDNEISSGVLIKSLGFRLSDETRAFRFLRANTDHHTMVMGFKGPASLNHIAFEMPDLDSVMRGAGRMRDNGYPIEWGPGRHGPGSNVFCYFCGPEEMPLEYTGEMMQVDETYRTGMPDDWTWPPKRLDRWGVSDFPSARVERAQRLFRFTADGWQLGG